ncbi:hypothetical protein [Mycoplasmopsis lipofaciens]|uniref:hypothetical protein n=1 Tax=Mycoplasmopsis lipofaciens TaxID=114884 RepID=UPI000487F1D5|nr:hypothetical protein [Mycoplasmopsis lipofaciens]
MSLTKSKNLKVEKRSLVQILTFTLLILPSIIVLIVAGNKTMIDSKTDAFFVGFSNGFDLIKVALATKHNVLETIKSFFNSFGNVNWKDIKEMIFALSKLLGFISYIFVSLFLLIITVFVLILLFRIIFKFRFFVFIFNLIVVIITLAFVALFITYNFSIQQILDAAQNVITNMKIALAILAGSTIVISIFSMIVVPILAKTPESKEEHIEK